MSSRSGEVLPGGVLRLPAGSAAPDGCVAWDGEAARHWTRALPPRWIPVRARASVFVALPVAAVAGAGLLGEQGALPGWGAALVTLHLVWLVLRPEAAVVLAPVAVVVMLVAGDELSPAVRLGYVAGLAGVWAAVCLRLAARRRQRAAGLAAAGGVTAGAPEGMGERSPRGTFLMWSGLGTVAAGGVLHATVGLWDGAGDRQGVPAAGWCLAGVGLTMLLSAALGRRRAADLRRAPVPVLRVLVRENADAETEVFAADDLAARRPLFTVSTAALGRAPGAGKGEGEGGGGGGDVDVDFDVDGGDEDDAELRELIERVDAERVGPLREAMLYGAPYDGAEVVFLAAAAKAGRRPVVETSLGPVRPMTEASFRRWARGERAKAAREARLEERHRAAAAFAAAVVADRGGLETAVRVRRWRAGWADWFAVVLVVLFLAFYWDAAGWWRDVFGLCLTLVAALMGPRRLLWRITADRAGLWFNELRGTGHLAWEDIRAVECEGVRLRIRGRQASFEEWRVASPRWRWLERRLGVLHPYERTAAEITAMWRDPAVRPVGEADERQRGRALWPLGVVIGALGVAAVFLLP
ncbi:hypothetical protein [Streptomyces sp900129855]|uniref:PH domain-containing protein n=1 Tax=Streptomyces sp. 900129855 TaxID=3155129 RepID=A0ABV2ZBZ0_9ACTN